MEQHLVTLKAHGWPESLVYRNTTICKPYITTKPTIHHQLFFPNTELPNFLDKYIGFSYNGRAINDVRIAEVSDKVLKTSKDYTFVLSKITDLHVTCREFTDSHKFECRPFSETPKV